MTLVTRDKKTGLRRGPIRFPDGHPLVPSGCRWCGIPEATHGRGYIASVGMHTWEQPTSAQVLRRMQARAKAQRHARHEQQPGTVFGMPIQNVEAGELALAEVLPPFGFHRVRNALPGRGVIRGGARWHQGTARSSSWS
ncbi:hypothetical protein AB0N14_17535 [Streptomyces sp. NPDC051104]|uniref:hypothetical protein n=1 Tax=Streptomyces sp. NPDC051104 TaxID=3155044 RepID=UPI00342950A9